MILKYLRFEVIFKTKKLDTKSLLHIIKVQVISTQTHWDFRLYVVYPWFKKKCIVYIVYYIVISMWSKDLFGDSYRKEYETNT